ncbi:NADPH-dependent ferric siderophore reductase, contains FAD-binding and SIP domains [Lutimaribacter pacificus]|uniref:NADPH-dependent ferric siderophore reductase, contains FAD-binding and SIP domains n=1 Tax=Lutimaribacter pacificus TaxID=391948 RepID=A0A1H0N774_9RHOB|nr:siderophore-interacting protein [Lutimaribacter pacificus]SDO88210.1 NADPH-dependent ferric siderophore reductase, contains FAD-binding and SIP domains [Lutimaribacter pacificus]SHK86653.1 NADPH-dependent ferric siderophore reductase, contains FAD-binding and SIP domains [Lutimaribacter pacificus]
MTYTAHATAIFKGALPADLVPHIAAHAREAELQLEESETSLIITVPLATVAMETGCSALRVRIDAVDRGALQNIRDYLLHILDHVAPGLTPAGDWQGDIVRNRPPMNFCTATVRGTRRVGPNFLRVELDCTDTKRLAEERGMHFSLLLPTEGRVPVWPQLDGNGRTVMPQGDDRLHRAAYTFVDLDTDRGRFTFDVFEHDGGRATTWARTARPGDIVGISGPGSGDIPPGQDILIAGDETALPAIRRILETSPADRSGHAFLEVGTDDDTCDLPRPEGIALTWLVRDRQETLWDHLATAHLPPGPDRYVWVAAEKALVRKAKARFREKLGLGANEGYFAYYWEA